MQKCKILSCAILLIFNGCVNLKMFSTHLMMLTPQFDFLDIMDSSSFFLYKYFICKFVFFYYILIVNVSCFLKK